MPKNNPPLVVLVRPQLGENIGAVARAMCNFGLKELRIVAPRDGWPNPRAVETASGGEAIIENAKIFPDVASALADVNIAYATTARMRDIEKRVVTPSETMEEMVGVWSMESKELPHSKLHKSPTRGEGMKIAFVFGPERTGLENDDVALCDAFITIPTAPDKSSLNLAQSVVVVGYEWWKRSVECGVWSLEKEKPHSKLHAPITTSAPKSDWQGLFDQLESYLDESGFFRVADKKPIMWQNMRNMFLRGRFTSQEIRTFRGMLRVLWEGRIARK